MRTLLKMVRALTALSVLVLNFLAFAVRGAGADAAGRTSESESSAKLPLTTVILYTSGVGYFERDGAVTDHAHVDFQFKVEDINDLLKSMVVQDFNGGRISTVTYGSRDPIAKTLKSFALDLTSNPTMGQLLNQVRGEEVEISRPNEMRGAVLGVEKKQQPAGENKIVDVEFLNLLTKDGLRSIPLEQIQKIQLVNPQTRRELQEALEVLATSHDTQKKTVRIGFAGEGKRTVRVSYIAATPVWKTSYRLVLDEKEPSFLQGWAIVENTSDEDWQEVRMALVSGRPISFTMDLYQPLYVTRPMVQPELYSSLRPPVYEDAVREARRLQEGQAEAAKSYYAMDPQLAARSGLKVESLARAAGPPLSVAGIGYTGMGGGGMGNVAAGAIEAQNAGADRRRILNQGIAPGAAGQETGELFEYSLSSPVTLARQKSAMLPILSRNIEGKKVAIYNASVQAKHPMSGFRLKNSTSLYLMQGPITVFEDGAYAGDARMNDLAPGQDRLISYALDLKTDVSQENKAADDIVNFHIKKGLLMVVRKTEGTATYHLRNHDKKKKEILIEHPYRADWSLTAPKQALERTSEFYRFLAPVAPDSSEDFAVREERRYSEEIQLLVHDLNQIDNRIGFYLRSRQISPAVKAALEKVVAMRNQLNQTQAEKNRRDQQVESIDKEQARIRENMKSLNQTSDLYTRYVKKFDQQETELERLRKEINGLNESADRQQKEINEYLLDLTIG